MMDCSDVNLESALWGRELKTAATVFLLEALLKQRGAHKSVKYHPSGFNSCTGILLQPVGCDNVIVRIGRAMANSACRETLPLGFPLAW